MANTTFSGVIRLRKDTEANFAKIEKYYIPEDGECCLIETSTGVRIKVGNGINFLADIEYIDTNLINQINSVVIRGYYLNNKFYTDSTYTQEIVSELTKVYVDRNSNIIYQYNGEKYISINDTLPTADDIAPGIMKLYQIPGQNTDGTMSQKVITNGIQAIGFNVDAEEEECLTISLPWS